MSHKYVYIVAEEFDYDYNPFSATYATFDFESAVTHLNICKEHEGGKLQNWSIWCYELDKFREPLTTGPLICDVVYPKDKE